MDGKFEGWTPEILASVCRWEGSADVFWSAMTQTFVDASEAFIVVHQWADENASLISAWKNGVKGGRPFKNNPRVTHGLPVGSPPVTHGVTDKIREDKRREDETRLETESKPKTARFAPPLRSELDSLAAEIGDDAGQHIEPFINYYSSNGWKVGKNKMADWKAAFRGWVLRNRNTPPQLPTRYGTSTPSDAPF